MRDRVDLAVIGGGAAGLTAAIGASRRGAAVVVLERLPRVGKKILATGGGRCNLSNEALSASSFGSTDAGLVESVLARFGRADIGAFFEGLGLRLQTDEAGRIYPATNQAASVLKVLEIEAGRRGIGIETGFDVDRIERSHGLFRLATEDGRRIEARAVVLAGGGRSYPALGSNGSGHRLAGSLGHRLVAPVPSAVPLLVKDRMCHVLQGQRLRVRVESRVDGRTCQTASGELLFAQYGLSGTAALDVSESLSIALNREGRRDTAVVVDFLPFMSLNEAETELARRAAAGWEPRVLGAGLLPEKFSHVLPELLREAGLKPGVRDASRSARRMAAALKAREFAVQGTRGWNEAEFTSGGVDAREVTRGTLESKLAPGLFLAGEVLDVQGGRGGFNLAWAWASGHVAGEEAAARVADR